MSSFNIYENIVCTSFVLQTCTKFVLQAQILKDEFEIVSQKVMPISLGLLVLGGF